jgi:hypothetical protein
MGTFPGPTCIDMFRMAPPTSKLKKTRSNDPALLLYAGKWHMTIAAEKIRTWLSKPWEQPRTFHNRSWSE